MAELKRKDEELTTADLAGTNTQAEIDRGPKLVRSEDRFGAENVAINDENAAREDAFNKGDNRIAERPNVAQNAAPAALFNDNEVGEFRNRWSNIQTGFVDEPRKAV